MGRDFSVIKTNIGNDIQDNTSAMNTLIGRYINRRYMQVIRAINFECVNDDYTISVTAGTDSYTLPTDFKTELYAVDSTNGNDLERVSFQDLSRDFENNISTSGAVKRYIIFTDDSNVKKIKFHYNPSADITVALPYYVTPSELSVDSDEPILDLHDLIEIGATVDAWRYKRQFGKAQQMEMAFNQMFADFIFKQENQPNMITQFKPIPQNRNNIY